MNTKLKLKLTMIAGALALAFAGQANAQIQQGNTGNGELFLSVWDTTSNTSYARGLGIDMNTFLGHAGVSFGTSASMFAATGDTAANNYSLAADANLTSFLGGATASTVQWSVVANDTTGLGYNGRKFLTTSSNFALGTAPYTAATETNGRVNNMAAGDGNYLATVNSLLPGGTTAGGVGSVFNKDSLKTSAAAGGGAYPDAPSNGFGNNMGSFLNGTNTTSLGNSMNFYLLTPSSGMGLAKATAYQFGNTAGLSTWTLGTNGGLMYSTAVAAVPEPGEWLLMLSGFGLVGFIATRRKNQSTGMTFA
jgi:hypothetical protein